jgi:glutathione synthase/RimK-type ligase-like ATP-grasp enzyme
VLNSNREKEEKQVNELNALVGKKKDIINKEGKTHKKRVAQAIKDSAKGEEVKAEVVDEEETKLFISMSDNMTPWLASGMLQCGLDLLNDNDGYDEDDEE